MIKKVLLALAGIIVLGAVGAITYLYIAFPAVGEAPTLTVAGTPEQIQRGKYLANHVTVCIDCHSTRDWSKFSGPIIKGTEGRGGDVFDERMGFPGTFYARNITPHNLGDWTDGDIYRTITTGVSKDGAPLFPVMPYGAYGRMDPDDVKAIIAYIRTLEPLPYESPESSANFPVNLIMRTMPGPAQPMERPDSSDVIEYGKYLVTIAACGDCHTPAQQGTPMEGMELAGGFEFELPAGIVRSANITPHPTTGIGNWTQEQFVARFKQYDVPADSLPTVTENGFNSVMPWNMYAGMTGQDLKAIFAYLQTVEPVEHKVVRFTPREQMTASN
jgi:mono/diheme cytochrome c family protein